MNELERNLAREFLDDTDLDGFYIIDLDEEAALDDDEGLWGGGGLEWLLGYDDRLIL